jgi:hypothetical protein
MSDQIVIDDTPEPDLIVPIENIDKIPIGIRDQYVSIDTDPMNLYLKTLFANETIANKNTDETSPDTVNEMDCVDGVDCVGCEDCEYEDDVYEYEYESFDDDDYLNYDNWEAEEKKYWEEIERKFKEAEKQKEGEEEYQRNRPLIEASSAPVDTRNRQGESTKADYRSSNSFSRLSFYENDPEIKSNIQEVMGGQSGIITSEAREPVTIINDLFPQLNLDNCRSRSRWRDQNGVGDANFFKLIEMLEEHSVSKVEHKKYECHRPRRIVKYKVPILRWDDVKYERRWVYDKLNKLDRERRNRQYEYEADAGKGIYRAHTRRATEEYTAWNGSRNSRVYIIIERVSRIGEFQEAVIPKGICPIDFKVAYSSSTHQKPLAKINRSTAFDTETQQMIDIGSAVDRTGCWKPHTNDDKEHLIIDMGQNTRVTHISTTGAPPPVIPFPGGHYARDTKFSDDYEGPNPNQKSLIYVLYKDRGGYSGGSYLQDYQLNRDGEWVESYELFARPDHGKWMRIGVYTGNSDPFAEVIHDVRRDLNDIKFRYLKFIPRSYHNHVAMKVDVFGLASDAEITQTIDRTHIIYTVDLPIRFGTKNGTELVRKHSVHGGYRRWDAEKEEYLERRARKQFLKTELSEYRNNKELYLNLYSPPNRDLHAIKFDLDREERDIAEAIRKSLKNHKRRRAYRKRVKRDY